VERDEQVRSQESGHAFNDSTAAETHCQVTCGARRHLTASR
jgi:hypothetical protein